MLHVVHVYKDFYPPVMGGIERCINWMASGVRALGGYEVTVLVNSRSRQTREREHEGIRIIEVGEWGRKFSAPISPQFPRWLRKLSADVWHFHMPNPTGDVSYLWTRPPGAVVATYHSDVVRQKWAMAAYRPFLEKFLARCDAVMPTSPRLIDGSPVLSRHRGKCTPVPLGMPLEPFKRTAEAGLRAREVKRRYSNAPLVVFVGQMRYYKGIAYLLGALTALPGVHALLIGSGYELEAYRAKARELGVGDRAHFLGALDDTDMIAHLHAADLFVLPSHMPSEAYGLSMVEAMAAGLPAICCDLPTGVPWVNQHGVTGLVVPPADQQALARAIAELLGDQTRRLAMAEAAYRRAHSEFTAERMAQRLDDVYRRVTGKA